jgi:signal transduction histidine kinase
VGLVGQLLLLYAGILLLDIVLSATLWLQRGGGLNRLLFLVWMATALSAVAQGLAVEGSFVITLGFATVFLVGLALAALLAALVDLDLPWRAYSAGLAAGLVASAAAAATRAPFWAVSLPTAVAVAAPLFHTALRSLVAPRRPLTASGRTLAVSCFLFCVHNLDYPFLRMREEFAALGFTIALFIVLALSITAPIVVLERVTEERLRIEHVSRLHNHFFANVSHELRTPLTLILAPVEQLLLKAATKEERALLDVVRRNATRLLQHIGELLDLSRIDVGGLRLNVAPLNLPALAGSIREKVQPTAEARGIDLRVEAPPTPVVVLGDAHRVESILTNLVANALDHTPSGGRIVIRVRDNHQRAVVEVSDNGPGIPETHLARIFERFFQASGVERRRGRGSGIGLALARELAELHGGALTAESTVGQGTTFSLVLQKGEDHFRPEVIERRRSFARLDGSDRRSEDTATVETPPLARPRPAAPAGPPSRVAGAIEGPRARILLVEDEEDMRSLLVDLLRPQHEVFPVGDGEAAIEMLPEVVPDLVISDVMMPGRSGIDLCRILKDDPRWCHTPVILLTALAGSETTLEAYALGADDFVTKPFHPQVLLARVTAQLRLRTLSTQLVAQEKVAAVGMLAAGVAHEVRNPLNAVMNAARLLRADGGVPKPNADLLEVMIDGTQRIEGIVAMLDTAVRPADEGGVQAYDVRKSLDATFALLGFRLGAIEIERRYLTRRNAVGPAGPLNQVLLNVVDNAIRSGAHRIVATVDDAEDGRVRVLIEDDGPGVPHAVADKIFDPFFTTRPVGEGTGLGLYLSRQVARKSGGELRLVSGASRGAAFELLLPTQLARERGKDA